VYQRLLLARVALAADASFAAWAQLLERARRRLAAAVVEQLQLGIVLILVLVRRVRVRVERVEHASAAHHLRERILAAPQALHLGRRRKECREHGGLRRKNGGARRRTT
jgi:hypothetical protein